MTDASPATPITKAQMDEKRMLAKAGCDMNAKTYLALDTAARKAFEALAELIRTADEMRTGELGRHDPKCPMCKAVAIARAALPEGWEK